MATPFPPITSNDKEEIIFNRTLRFTDDSEDTYIEFDFADPLTRGIKLRYDRNTIQPKTFEINENGLSWTDGTTPYTTALGRLCAVQQAFQAVELPPNATTLKLNDKLKLESSGSNTIISPLSATMTDTYSNTLRYKPKLAVQSLGNTAVSIPTTTPTQYEVMLRGVQVSLTQRLEPQPLALTYTGTETILCSLWTGSYQYVGCASGRVYWYDPMNQDWYVLWEFDDEVRCLMYHTGNVYAGGKFVQLNAPTSIIGLYRICYWNDNPNSASISAVVMNTGGFGFNAPVNAMVSDGSNYFYIGGEFTGDNNGVGNTNYFACYNNSSGDLENLDSIGGASGFDLPVWNLSYLSGYLTATGEFTQLTNVNGTNPFNFCVNFDITSNNTGSNVNALFGDINALTTKIDTLKTITNDGTYFYIPVNDITYSANYLVQAPYYNFASSSATTGNNYDAPLRNVVYAGAILATTTNGKYWSNGVFQATLGATNTYFMYNSAYSPNILFFYNGGDLWYGFTGATTNTFNLNGRTLLINNGTYTGAIIMTNPYGGDNITLDFDGTYFRVIGQYCPNGFSWN